MVAATDIIAKSEVPFNKLLNDLAMYHNEGRLGIRRVKFLQDFLDGMLSGCKDGGFKLYFHHAIDKITGDHQTIALTEAEWQNCLDEY